MKTRKHTWHIRAVAALASLAIVGVAPAGVSAQPVPPTNTPIKHVIVIFDENISFDHYFATYPHALNPSGETPFHAKTGTPSVNNLLAAGLLQQNPNSVNPFRLGPADAVTCDENHDYTPEQQAFDSGLMDKFPEFTGSGSSPSSPCNDLGLGTGIVMGYFDGNTVTGLWNYAQYFALSDNSFSTQFGPSTVGAINLIAGNTFGGTIEAAANGSPASAGGNIANGGSTGAVIGDPRPYYDDCVATNSGLAGKTRVSMSETTIGDVLSARGLTWGWFQGGYKPTSYTAQGLAVCASTHTGLAGVETDYVPHHNPVAYFPQFANPHHLPPSSVSAIGTTDQAGHQYDLSDLSNAFLSGNLPAVSFLKAAAYQDGHPGNSDPIDEQTWIVGVVNAVENSPYWKDTAIFVLYDDSDGWYDHVIAPIVNQSNVTDDNLVTAGSCGTAKAVDSNGDIQNGRCGYGPRQPLLVISPYSKENYVDHGVTDQSSVIRFIEDNWGLPRIGGGSTDARAGLLLNFFDFSQSGTRKVFLDPATGKVTKVSN